MMFNATSGGGKKMGNLSKMVTDGKRAIICEITISSSDIQETVFYF
jgi:hypothetical protein